MPDTTQVAATGKTAGRGVSALRGPLLATGALAMGIGLYAGLLRMGWPLPAGAPLAEMHGPLMVSGFFGTVISLERAVALDRPWAYLAPAAAALGAIALIAGAPPITGTGLFVFAGLAATVNAAVVMRLQPALFTAVMLVGAVCWLLGNTLLMLGTPVMSLVGWWLGFFVATIAAERLELSRLLLPPSHAKFAFIVLIALVLAGAILGVGHGQGSQLLGGGFFGLAVWLWRYDIARSTIRRPGQTRYFAASLLLGYFWLGAAGLVAITGGVEDLAYGYDLFLHLVLIGFVLSMVFAHALIILPAVTGIRLAYSPWLYGPLFLLHLSVALRLAGGLLEIEDARMTSSVITLIALVSFAGTLTITRLARKHSDRKARG